MTSTTKLNYSSLNMTRCAAIGYSCLNKNCKFFMSNPTIENAIENGTFTAGIYSYYTEENNTTWSTDCYLCSECKLSVN